MPKTSLDAIDRKILKYLIKNARMPFLEIARECGIRVLRSTSASASSTIRA